MVHDLPEICMRPVTLAYFRNSVFRLTSICCQQLVCWHSMLTRAHGEPEHNSPEASQCYTMSVCGVGGTTGILSKHDLEAAC